MYRLCKFVTYELIDFSEEHIVTSAVNVVELRDCIGAAAVADYTLLRDRIEAVAALATAARHSAGALDLDAADTMTLAAKIAVADSVWSNLISEIMRLDV